MLQIVLFAFVIGVGIVILASILGTIGVPPAGVALIIGVDRLLDMSRTAVNIAGDLVASIFVDRRVLGQREQEPADAGIAADAASERGPDL